MTGRRPRLGAPLAQTVTILAVLVAWVFFAAPSFAAAHGVLSGMLGLHGVARPELLTLADMALQGGFPALRDEVGGAVMLRIASALSALAAGAAIVLAMPNTQQMIDGRAEQAVEEPRWPRLRVRLSMPAALAAAAAFLAAFCLMADVREFTYFQF